MNNTILTVQDRINISNGSWKFNPDSGVLVEVPQSFITRNRKAQMNPRPDRRNPVAPTDNTVTTNPS